MTAEDAIKLVTDKTGRLCKEKYAKHKDAVDLLMSLYNDSKSMQETLHRIKHNITKRPVCKNCGKPVEFVKDSYGYRQYCCYRCSRECSETMEKMKKTCDEKYGGIGFKSKELQEKSNNTSNNLYGENWRSTVQQVNARKTKLLKYGDENYNNIEQIK